MIINTLDWFQLEKYSSINSLTYKGWYEQIVIRRRLLSYFDDIDTFFDSYAPEGDSCSAKSESDGANIFEKLLKDPISKHYEIDTDEEFLTIFSGDNLDFNELEKNYESYRPVALPSIKNTAQQITSLPDNKLKEYTLKWMGLLINKNMTHGDYKKATKAINERMPDEFNQSILKSRKTAWGTPRSNIHLNIDLSFSDKHIIEDLEKQLSILRKSIGATQKEKRQRTPDINSWCHSKALPYFDLFLWANFTGTTLTQEDYCEILFPYGSGDISNFKKTTLKHVNLFTKTGIHDVLDKLMLAEMENNT